MAVSVSGDGALEFDAVINVDGFINGQNIMEQGLQSVAKAAIDASKVTTDAFAETAQSQIGIGKTAEKSADQVFQAWKAQAEKIVRLAQEAGTQAGQAFEFKQPPIDGVESSTMISPEQLSQMKIALTMLDQSLTTQQQIQKTGLSEIEFLQTKNNLLNEIGQKIDAESAAKIAALEKQKQQEADIADLQRQQTWGGGSSPTGRAMPDINNILGEAFKKTLQDAGQSFDDLDSRTKGFIRDLVNTEFNLNRVAVAQKKLKDEYANGNVAFDQYKETLKNLAAEEKNLSDGKKNIIAHQKEYEASLGQEIGSLQEKKAALTGLKQAYTGLSAAQRESPEGVDMAKNIASLNSEIKSLDPSKIEATKDSVIRVRTELMNLENLMARNPNSPLFDTWKKQATDLQLSYTEAKKSIEQGINPSAGIDAFASGLQGLVGGFTALTGVMGLFTTDQKEYEKVTKDAASALALLNGVQQVANVLAKNSQLNVYLQGLMRKSNAASIALETTATEVNTGVQEANAVATEGAAVAQKGLAAALLSNPAGLVIAGIAALAVAYLALRKNASEAKAVQDALNDTMKDFAKGMASADEEVKSVQNAFRLMEGGLISQKDALKKYNDTLGDTFGKTNDLREAERLLNSKVDVYIQVMGLKSQANAAFAKSAQLAAQQVANSNTEMLSFWGKFKASFTDGNFFKISADYTAANKREQDEQNAILQKQQDALDRHAKYQMALAGQLAKNAGINANLADVDNDKVAKSKNKVNKEEIAYNKLLNEQKTLLQSLDALHHEAAQSGMTKEASELDKINEKYDLAIKKVEDYNAKVEAFNKKYPGKKQDLLPVDTLNADRAIELDNARQRKAADDYKKNLDIQKKYFDDYQKEILDIGKEKADELYKVQLQGSENYLDYLKKQKKAIEDAATPANKTETDLKLKANADATEKATADAVRKQLDDYKQLLQATITFNDQKAKINKHYDDLEATARAKTIDPAELAAQLKILEEFRKEALTEAENDMMRHSDLYKKMGEDITFFTVQELKKRVNDFKVTLKMDKNLSPAMKAALKSQIDQLNSLIHQTDTTSVKTLELSNDFSAVASGLSDISSALSGVDDTLSKMIGTIGKLAGAVSVSLKSIDTLKDEGATTSDKIGASLGLLGVGFSVLNMVSGLFNAADERRAKAYAEAQAALLTYQQGEIAINDEYRKRLLMQAQLNKLKLEGLKAEADALKQNAESLQKDYADVLKLIQEQGRAVPIGYSQEYLTYLQIANPDQYKELTNLANKSFDDLQKLFMTGQLDDKAKALFQTLQNINQEIADNGTAALDNIQNTSEALTATTADSILDSIVKGFADGKRATADFAEDFEDLMKQAVLNSLKYQTLEAPLQKFYEDFAAAAKSDDVLTEAEIASLQASYNATIEAAGKQFDELKKITNLSFSGTDSSTNSLSGAIKGITQQQADLLAGQFGGLRMTAFDQLNVARSQLNALNEIVNNTSLLVQVNANIQYLKTNGIKIL